MLTVAAYSWSPHVRRSLLRSRIAPARLRALSRWGKQPFQERPRALPLQDDPNKLRDPERRGPNAFPPHTAETPRATLESNLRAAMLQPPP